MCMQSSIECRLRLSCDCCWLGLQVISLRRKLDRERTGSIAMVEVLAALGIAA